MSVADKMADGNRLQFLITIGARVTMPTGIVIGADNQAFRAAVDLAMELAKNG
jgi:hypothetical protein